MNGEPWRARAWGWVLPQLADPDERRPGDNWGDLGACSSLACASACLARPRRGTVRIWSLSEDGAAGCIRLT